MQRILAIDDDPAVTSVLKRGLSYEGFAVDTAGSGEEGLAIARERAPDLVILDVMMPGIDGIEVLRRLRAADGQLPVLRFADLTLDTGTRRARRGEREIDLTSTEYDLLRQFLEHPRRVLPKEALLERVWGYDFGGNTNVLEVYVKQLRQKLEAEGAPRLIHTLRGTGYVLREE